MHTITMRLSGEFALLLELKQPNEQTLDATMPAQIRQLAAWCGELCGDAVQEIVPSYHTLLLSFTPYHPRWPAIIDELENACKQWQTEFGQPLCLPGQLLQLPVWYNSNVAPDLAAVAHQHGLSTQQVAALHSAIDYPVYAVGFTPGFAYLGFVDQQLATPRHATPRVSVPAGSVAIADRQTAVYPTATPGGWNIIGQSPIPLSPDWCQVGDRVRFVAVDEARFYELRQHPSQWQLEVTNDPAA